MGCRGMHRPITPVFDWAFLKSSTDTFITVIYAVHWLAAYKCFSRGEALGFWTWLCKNYLCNQFLGGVIFCGVMKWIQGDILLLLWLLVRVNKNVKKSTSVCQPLVFKRVLLFIRHDFQESIKAFSFYQLSICGWWAHNRSVLIQSAMFSAANDIQGQSLFYGVLVWIIQTRCSRFGCGNNSPNKSISSSSLDVLIYDFKTNPKW